MRKNISPAYQYIQTYLPVESELKLQARLNSEQLGLGGISISQVEAHLIRFLCQMIQPKKILEIGTLTGLSALYFLDTLKEGVELWTLEKSPEHVDAAKKVLPSSVHIVEGDAAQTLPQIQDKGPFDIIFIDGNKAAYGKYWDWAKSHVSLGGLVIIDNVFLAGSVWGDHTLQKFSEKQIAVMKNMTQDIFQSNDFLSTFLPTEEGLIVAQRKHD